MSYSKNPATPWFHDFQTQIDNALPVINKVYWATTLTDQERVSIKEMSLIIKRWAEKRSSGIATKRMVYDKMLLAHRILNDPAWIRCWQSLIQRTDSTAAMP